MRILVNGQPRAYAPEEPAADLAALFAREAAGMGLDGPAGIAIALNGRVVRRADWAHTRLGEGDRVEIVRAMQGG